MIMRSGKLILLFLFALTLIAARGCQIGSGTIEGTVTNSMTGSGVGGVEVTLRPGITISTSDFPEPVIVTTDADGTYSAIVPAGSYNITFARQNYKTAQGSASVGKRVTATVNAELEPTAKVVVNAGPDQEGEFGASVALNGSVEILDGSSLVGYQWTQTAGANATLTNNTSLSATAQLGTYEAHKAALLAGLEQIDRFGIQGINPHALEGGKTDTFKLTVKTSSGSYSDSANVELPLPLQVASGIQNVPINVPVLLHGKTQASYNWVITKPSGSTATLEDSTTQDPYFTPDIVGEYTIEEESSETSIKVYAGTYQGGITDQDANDNPVMGSCTACHSSPATYSETFEEWAESGHAHIFSDNINTSDHYGENCLSCHTVGYLSGANGIDQASDWDAFIDSGLLHAASPTNWSTVLSTYPQTAKLANIQCENCHGPNIGSTLHLNGKSGDEERVSISSDVCAVCHGEPPRHGRFQQWEESGHANFELAIEEGENGNCGRCHSGQGFLYWIKQPNPNASIPNDQLEALGMTVDKVQPQTCVVCHDPHFVGTISGDTTDAPMRIEEDTPQLLAGFKATNVGKGAICMVCHNSRRGLRNDLNPHPSNNYNAPHDGAQGDVLMGQNAFFVEVGQRSSHANIDDSCVTCHMEATPPPAGFSYNQSGTNHTFEASITICSQCHTGLDGSALQGSVELMLEDLRKAISTAASDKLNGLGTVKVRAYDPATGLFSSDSDTNSNVAINVAANNVTVTDVYYLQGQTTFAITLATPIDISWQDGSTTTTGSFSVQMRSLKDASDELVYKSESSNMFRACWNYILIIFDSSKGVHNPSFVANVLKATVAQDLSF